jgi:hypothetical protein
MIELAPGLAFRWARSSTLYRSSRSAPDCSSRTRARVSTVRCSRVASSFQPGSNTDADGRFRNPWESGRVVGASPSTTLFVLGVSDGDEEGTRRAR